MTKIVKINSLVTINIEGQLKKITLVRPDKINIMKGKISIESPIGAALLSHKEGSTVSLEIPPNKQIQLKIIKVQ